MGCRSLRAVVGGCTIMVSSPSMRPPVSSCCCTNYCYWRYGTLTTRLLCCNAEGGLLDFDEAAGEAFAFGVDEGRGAGAGDRIGGAAGWDLARESWHDHAGRDEAIIGDPARVGVAIAFDQPRAFGDFQRQGAGEFRRCRDLGEPGDNRLLLLMIAMAEAAPALELGEQQETQIARD